MSTVTQQTSFLNLISLESVQNWIHMSRPINDQFLKQSWHVSTHKTKRKEKSGSNSSITHQQQQLIFLSAEKQLPPLVMFYRGRRIARVKFSICYAFDQDNNPHW